MEVIHLQEIATATNPRGVQVRHLIRRQDVAVSNLVLKPGETLAAHVTPVDVVFYVVEGRGQIQIGEESAQVAATDLVVSPAGIPHGLTADPDSLLSVLVVKTPNPARQG